MFADLLVPNLVVFLIGQIAAISYLRTGLVRRGLLILVVTWVLADAALVARFGYQHVGRYYLTSLGGMQIVSMLGAAAFAFGRVRRRLKGVRSRRRAIVREAFVHYLRNELDAARVRYEKLLRVDPWDVTARLGLATVLVRLGRPRRARRLLRSVRALDSTGELEGAVAAEQQRIRRALRTGVALKRHVAPAQHVATAR